MASISYFYLTIGLQNSVFCNVHVSWRDAEVSPEADCPTSNILDLNFINQPLPSKPHAEPRRARNDNRQSRLIADHPHRYPAGSSHRRTVEIRRGAPRPQCQNSRTLLIASTPQPVSDKCLAGAFGSQEAKGTKTQLRLMADASQVVQASAAELDSSKR
jgi:hypothetical protein